jgi:hypothetical protein
LILGLVTAEINWHREQAIVELAWASEYAPDAAKMINKRCHIFGAGVD